MVLAWNGITSRLVSRLGHKLSPDLTRKKWITFEAENPGLTLKLPGYDKISSYTRGLCCQGWNTSKRLWMTWTLGQTPQPLKKLQPWSNSLRMAMCWACTWCLQKCWSTSVPRQLMLVIGTSARRLAKRSYSKAPQERQPGGLQQLRNHTIAEDFIRPWTRNSGKNKPDSAVAGCAQSRI